MKPFRVSDPKIAIWNHFADVSAALRCETSPACAQCRLNRFEANERKLGANALLGSVGTRKRLEAVAGSGRPNSDAKNEADWCLSLAKTIAWLKEIDMPNL